MWRCTSLLEGVLGQYPQRSPTSQAEPDAPRKSPTRKMRIGTSSKTNTAYQEKYLDSESEEIADKGRGQDHLQHLSQNGGRLQYSRAVPPAQHESVSRPAYSGEHRIGVIWASPVAVPWDVTADIECRIQPDAGCGLPPSNSILMESVHYITFPRAEFVYRMPMTDLRITEWETFNRPRIIPVIRRGDVVHYLSHA